MEDGFVEELGTACWAAAIGDRQKNAIRCEMNLCKFIRDHEDFQRVGSDVLHALLQGLST